MLKQILSYQKEVLKEQPIEKQGIKCTKTFKNVLRTSWFLKWVSIFQLSSRKVRKYQLNLQASVKASECKPGIRTPVTLTRTNPGGHPKKWGLFSSKPKPKPPPCGFLLPWLSCLRCGVLKKLHTPCAQMTKISRGLSVAWMCFPAHSPVFWLFPSFPGCPALRSAVLGARSPRSRSAPGLKRNIGSSSLRPGRRTTPPVRGNYLIHEWTCLFIGVSPWRWVFVAPKRSLYVCNPSLSQQYGMCRALEW